MDKTETPNSSEKDVYGSGETVETVVDRANAAAERLEAANQKAEQLKRELEERQVRERLAGKTVSQPVKEPEEESPSEYAKRLLRGEL